MTIKISQLPAAAVPLSGAELVPMVQAGQTVFVPASAIALPLLGTSSGSSLVGWIRIAIGALATTIANWIQNQPASVLDFAGVDSTGATDSRAGIQAALTAVGINGGKLYLPPAAYTCSGNLNIPINVEFYGGGKSVSVITFTNVGDGINSTHPINSSTAARSRLAGIGLVNTNVANTGGGFVDVGGSFVDVFNAYFQGWKYNTIFDQTEIATIDNCEYGPSATTTGDIWLVNGADHTGGALINFTNRITLTRNQHNSNPGITAQIIDDGGTNHSIRDNNFNSGLAAIRAAGVYGLIIEGNESEVHTQYDVVLANTTRAGATIGPCFAPDIRSNTLISPGTGNINIIDVVGGSIENNTVGQAVAAAFNFTGGANNLSSDMLIRGNKKLVSGVGKTATPFISGNSTIIRANKLLQTAHTYVVASQAAGTIVVTPASMEFIGIGTRLRCENADFTNPEQLIVTAYTATTFTANFVSTKAANWMITGITQYNEQELIATIALAGSSTAGTNTYSAGGNVLHSRRDGNKVHCSGVLNVSGNSVAMAGNLRITGLPYTAENIGMNFSVNVSWWTGFTFAGAYTQLSGTIDPATNFIALRKNGSAVTSALLPLTDMAGATCSIVFEATYYTKDL